LEDVLEGMFFIWGVRVGSAEDRLGSAAKLFRITFWQSGIVSNFRGDEAV
jgi:hypothetical protein